MKINFIVIYYIKNKGIKIEIKPLNINNKTNKTKIIYYIK